MGKTIPLEVHEQVVCELMNRITEADQLRLVTAIVLVQSAGGMIRVPGILDLQVSGTSYITEDVDPSTGDRIFRTFNKPPGGELH